MSARTFAWCGALAVAVIFLVASVGRSGLWDPPEVDRAELARRVAIHLFGAKSLALAGGPNSMPTLSDLGSGELGVTSMAAGFATLGLHDYAGRLPLALWAVAGVLVLFFFLARTISARVGLYAAIVLCTMPLYFMQARTMLGDIVTMAAFTAAFCGALGAMLDRRSPLATAVWLVVAAGGLLAGYLARGLLIGVAGPALGVGLSWCVVATSGAGWTVWSRSGSRSARSRSGKEDGEQRIGGGWLPAVVGVACLLVGLAAAGAFFWWLGRAPAGEVSRLVGMKLATRPPLESTFDLVVRDLGHALFPWSALIPWAGGRLWWVGQSRQRPADGALVVRAALLIGAAVAYGSYAVVAPYAGAMPFAAPALLAAVVALALDDYQRGAPASPAVAGGAVLLGLVLLADFKHLPAKALVAFGVGQSHTAASLQASGTSLLSAACGVFCLAVVISWAWRPVELSSVAAGRAYLRRRMARGRAVATDLASVWKGNLVFGALVVEAALVGLGAMLFMGRLFDWRSVATMPRMLAFIGLNAWWATPLGLLGAALLVELARLLTALICSSLGVPAAVLTLLGGLVAGALLCFGYYPSVAAQLSPKEAFESYGRLHAGDEPLGIIGLRARVARYYSATGELKTLAGPRVAQRWLDEGDRARPDARRWLVFRRHELPEINAAHRQAHHSNLPVLDARSQQILLASNQLGAEPNHNPLDAVVLDEAPARLQHPLDGRFGQQLQALGWQLTTADGEPAEYVVPARRYHLRLFFRVLSPLRRTYKVFIHIDGYHRRHNGDHDVLGGNYPMRNWLLGDIVVDDYPLTLEPNFLPGKYTVYFGFFAGKQRLEVTRGRHHDNRLNGGVLLVR